jgi:MobA/MobL family
MATFHLRVSTFSRARGQSAIGASCYRAANRMRAWTGQHFDYRAKSPGVVSSWLTGWTGNRSTLWNRAERAETRKNSTVAREVQASIPRELNDEQGAALCRRFASWLSETYAVAVDTSIHRPGGAARRDRNPHAHFLFTTRRVDPLTGTFGNKTREWDARAEKDADISGRDEITGRALFGRGCVDQVRQQWEEMANAALAEAGRSERIDRRTLAEQGIDREPINYTRAALELEKRGMRTEQSEEMRRRKKRNRLRPARAAVGRAVPVPHIEREEIAEAPTTKQERAQTRETPRREARREIERKIIRTKHRAATGAEKEQKPAPTQQPQAQRPKAPTPPKERRREPTR